MRTYGDILGHLDSLKDEEEITLKAKELRTLLTSKTLAYNVKDAIDSVHALIEWFNRHETPNPDPLATLPLIQPPSAITLIETPATHQQAITSTAPPNFLGEWPDNWNLGDGE